MFSFTLICIYHRPFYMNMAVSINTIPTFHFSKCTSFQFFIYLSNTLHLSTHLFLLPLQTCLSISSICLSLPPLIYTSIHLSANTSTCSWASTDMQHWNASLVAAPLLPPPAPLPCRLSGGRRAKLSLFSLQFHVIFCGERIARRISCTPIDSASDFPLVFC